MEMLPLNEPVTPETERLLESQQTSIYRETDRTFTKLFLFQWVAGMVIALWTPLTWSGTISHINPHVWFALFMGGAISFFPLVLVKLQPGAVLTRHAIAVSQMLTSALLILLTGGRIETHFHVFGSLAFLAFYRDWKVLVTASVVTAVDHLVRGVYWPASIFGPEWSNHWRWVEHTAWVIFADVFLIRLCLRSQAEMLIIAQRQAKQEHLLYQAQHDALTGLPNRLLFAQKMEAGLRRAREFSCKLGLLCIDLDRFKQVNDSLGHHVGDELLSKVGQRLTENLAAGESVIRMGGDEFALVCEDIHSAADAERTAAKLLKALQEEFHVLGHRIHIGASIGISVFPETGASAAELQKHADIAMYRAKRESPRGFESFSPVFAKSTLKKMELEYDLYSALERHELVLHYQPQVRLDGALMGFEALMRWVHPELGLLLPGQFITLGEEVGLIVGMGAWALRQACEQAMEWQSQFGQNLRMAINVSALQLADSAFPCTVSRILQQTGLPAELLELEITETLLMSDMANNAKRLRQLAELGVRIAVDDFGTGFSPLLYLQKLPIGVLKIDREFVAGMDAEANTLPLVESVLTLARTLNLQVVAKGVERQSQAFALNRLGCDYAQGFLFGKSVSVNVASVAVRAAAEQRECAVSQTY
jgi:diguanylate cyclase (GGDEF)-like protein